MSHDFLKSMVIKKLIDVDFFEKTYNKKFFFIISTNNGYVKGRLYHYSKDNPNGIDEILKRLDEDTLEIAAPRQTFTVHLIDVEILNNNFKSVAKFKNYVLFSDSITGIAFLEN